jgi:hypothetical protein
MLRGVRARLGSMRPRKIESVLGSSSLGALLHKPAKLLVRGCMEKQTFVALVVCSSIKYARTMFTCMKACMAFLEQKR